MPQCHSEAAVRQLISHISGYLIRCHDRRQINIVINPFQLSDCNYALLVMIGCSHSSNTHEDLSRLCPIKLLP